MAKDESRRDRWVKASQRLRNAFPDGGGILLHDGAVRPSRRLLRTPCGHGSARLSQMSMAELVGISTIVAVTAAAVALLVRMISRNERAVAEGDQLAEENRRDLDCAQYPGLCGRLPAAADPGRTVHAVDYSLIPERAKSNLRRICQ